MHLLYKAFCLATPEKFLPSGKLITLCCAVRSESRRWNLLQIASLLTTMTKLGHVSWWRDRIFTVRIITPYGLRGDHTVTSGGRGQFGKTQAYNWGQIWGIYLEINSEYVTPVNMLLCWKPITSFPKTSSSQVPILLGERLVAFQHRVLAS